MDIIDHEQDKHDKREQRRIQNQANANNTNNNPANTDTHNNNNNAPDINTNHHQNAATNHFINTAKPSAHQDTIDINAIADNADNVKYFEDDDDNFIIIKDGPKAKRGQWKKADAALGYKDYRSNKYN